MRFEPGRAGLGVHPRRRRRAHIKYEPVPLCGASGRAAAPEQRLRVAHGPAGKARRCCNARELLRPAALALMPPPKHTRTRARVQRGVPATLWGWTTPGGSVTVSVSGGGPVIASLPAGPDGRWNATLPAAPASVGGVGVNISIVDGTSGATTVLSDVLYGDVVWCSGQSNLSGGNTPVAYAFNASAEIAAAALYPWVRVFTVGTYDGGSPVPLPQLSQVCGADLPAPWSMAALLHEQRVSLSSSRALAGSAHPLVGRRPRLCQRLLCHVLVSWQGPGGRARAVSPHRPTRVGLGGHRDPGMRDGNYVCEADTRAPRHATTA